MVATISFIQSGMLGNTVRGMIKELQNKEDLWTALDMSTPNAGPQGTWILPPKRQGSSSRGVAGGPGWPSTSIGSNLTLGASFEWM